jgi:hypothetical protein
LRENGLIKRESKKDIEREERERGEIISEAS